MGVLKGIYDDYLKQTQNVSLTIYLSTYFIHFLIESLSCRKNYSFQNNQREQKHKQHAIIL